MFEGEDIAFNGLEVCSYRHLQGMAKNMGLPSNVKKVHLIEMIRAKKYCTASDLKAIVDRVKMERKAKAQTKKKKPKRKPFRLQGTEVSSTSNSQSPPITHTPKRSSEFVIEYSPDITQTIMKYQPRPNILRTGTSILQPLKRHIESDRVLRSFNSIKRPNYRIMEQNDCVVSVVSAQNSIQELRQERVQELRQERAFQSVNLTIQKERPIVSSSVVLNRERQMVPASRSTNIAKPAKRQRKLSGIYPLQTRDKPFYEYVPTVGFRRTDGRVTKINAIIQKPLSNALLPKTHNLPPIQKQAIVTVQDVINYKVGHSSIAEGSRIYSEIDQSNENDLYNVYPIEANHIDIEMLSHVAQKTTEPIHSMPDRNMGLANTRKVYKGRQSKTNPNKGWNYTVDYQENTANKEWNIYDINGQSLDKTQKEQNEIQCYTHRVKDSEPISTNYRVKQGRITEPVSRDYQVEYQRFNEELKYRNVASLENKNRRSNADGNVSVARSDYKIQRFNQETNRNNDARYGSDQQHHDTDRNIDHARSINKDHFNQDITDICLVRSENKGQGLNQDTDRNVDHARCHIKDQSKPSTIEQWSKGRGRTKSQRCDGIGANSQYPNMAALTDVFPSEDYTQSVDNNSNFSVYYHKKIRAEQVKTLKGKDCETLPRINEVFSQFNDIEYRNLTQPLYVQVSAEADRVPPLSRVIQATNSTCMLESIYNFKNQFLINPPVLLISRTQTQCTYSTRTVSTAVAQSATAVLSNNGNPYERVNPNQPSTAYIPRLCDYLKPEYMPTTTFGCDEVLSSSTASLETTNSQEPDNVTIPEMVEDALELISQDGDYMERIGMDVRVQCILCDWAGPKIILEYHIKKVHFHGILQASSECSVLFSLGEVLAHQTWYSQLLQHEHSLYALSAKCTQSALLLSLSMIPTESEITKRGRITVYNKKSGKPYTYEGEIKHLPDSMPYEYGLECLEINIGSLDLIPNSANFGLDSKVGQLSLNNVEIVVYVKLLD